jgi:hypothetical protein
MQNSIHLVYAHVEPMGKVLSRLRAALRKSDLEIAFEWDLAYDIRQDFGVVLAPCRILCIYAPTRMLQTMVVDVGSSVSQPVLVSVCEREGHARIYTNASAGPIRESVLNAVDSIGARRILDRSAA